MMEELLSALQGAHLHMPLNVTDAGTYECHVTVTPQDSTFISTATISNSRSISVSGMYNTIVS